jgi:hypothetical protein
MKKKMIPKKDRPTQSITIRMPEDMLEQLKRVAPRKGMSGYQPLMKFYITQGLRKDLQLIWEEEEMAKAFEALLKKLSLKEEEKSEILDFFEGMPKTWTA